MKRVQISFSKGKHKKVKTLASHNQEIQEILGCSERIIPILSVRKTSEPVALFEKIRQSAGSVYNALERHLKCHGRNCRSHEAHLSLRAETKLVTLNVLFMFEGETGSYAKSIKQEVVIQPAEDSVAATPAATIPISYVQRATSFATAQQRMVESPTKISGSSLGKLLSRRPKSLKNAPPAPLPAGGNAKLALQHGMQAHSGSPISAITNSLPPVQNPRIKVIGTNNLSSHLIVDLCSSLRTSQEPALGVIADEFDRQFQLCKSPKPSPAVTAPDTAKLTPLPQILEAYNKASIDISRKRRFEMAAHIASALLQIQMSPWLSTGWSKHDFYFLADSHTIYSDYPYVSQSLTMNAPVCPTPTVHGEEDARVALSTVGMIILELIFGHNIESCSFRHLYYGANNQPNDQTDICTARRWGQEVLGECGEEIADVVRRCLDCAFGPRPNFQDKRFREAIYNGVIKPLADHQKLWQAVLP